MKYDQASTTAETSDQASIEASTGGRSTITTNAEIPSETVKKDEEGSGGGLSAGAAAGIGAGTGVAVLLIGAIAVVLLLKRRRRKQAPVGNPPGHPNPAPPWVAPYELPSSGGPPKPQELYSPPAEMEGNHWQR